jgi:hypothetical protein
MIHVARGGTFMSTDTVVGGWALGEFGTTNNRTTFIIDGAIDALETNGIVTRGSSNISVTGVIQAWMNGLFIGLFGAGGDTVLNSGHITGGLHDHGGGSGGRFRHGIIVEGADTRITNLAGGSFHRSPEFGGL